MSTYDILINNLTKGDNYTVTDAEGHTYQVHNPPNKYMLQAARAIKQILSITESDQATIQTLNKLNATLQEELDVLKTQTNVRSENPLNVPN